MSPELQAFYEYHRCFNEPWDGPAALCLHRWHHRRRLPRSQRPAPRALQADRRTASFSLGSEVGTIEFDDADDRGKRPPRARRNDRDRHRARHDSCATRRSRQSLPSASRTASWLKDNLVRLEELTPIEPQRTDRAARHAHARAAADRLRLHDRGGGHDPQADGAGRRGSRRLHGRRHAAGGALAPAAAALHLLQAALRAGHESADRSDPREARDVAATSSLGWRRNLLAETPEHARLIQPNSPILFEHELDALRDLAGKASSRPSPSTPRGRWRRGRRRAWSQRIDRICGEAEAAVLGGARIVILSDRASITRMSPCRCCSPPARCIITSSARASG